MTVNEIRVRLGKIMMDSFTEEFSRKYEVGVRQITKNPLIADKYVDASTDFIDKLMFIWGDYKKIDKLVRTSNPVLIYTFYIRYYSLTQELIGRNQNELVSVPDSDRDFFRFVLTDFWMDIFS